MRYMAFRRVVAIGAATLTLGACAGVRQGGFAGAPQGGFPGLPVASRSLGLAPQNRPGAHAQLANIRNALLIADRGSNAVEILRSTDWSNRGRITDGILEPRGSWVDNNGSLYVANVGNANGNGSVTEYNSNGHLIFTYGAHSPVAVTTDAGANVYVGDLSGNVVEYGQLDGTASATCTTGGEVRGVAVDKQRDVFISYYSSAARGVIEYPHGLRASHCNGTLLPVTLYYPNGLIVDPQGRLLVCDVTAGVVDIIAPPYTSITGTFGEPYSGPITVTINRSATQAYVVEAGMDIQVLTYPAGTMVAVLNVGSGLSGPFSAVNSRNYVP